MLNQVFVSGISPEGTVLIEQYLEAFAPDTEIVPFHLRKSIII